MLYVFVELMHYLLTDGFETEPPVEDTIPPSHTIDTVATQPPSRRIVSYEALPSQLMSI